MIRLALFVLLTGCLKNAAYPCSQDVDCARGGETGVCEPATGFCSFTDSSCPGGRRYGDLSGSVANTCVGDIAGDGPGPDFPDAPPGCFGTALVQICPATAPTDPVSVSGVIDTDGAGPCQAFTSPTNTVACVIIGTDVTIGGSVRATGSKPLVLVASQNLTFPAGTTVDVSSVHLGPSIGAAGDSTSCIAGTDATLGGTGSGGFGGSFGGTGGNGGNGAAATGGIAAAANTGGGFRGGCRGGIGAGTNSGTGGHGGGAVYGIAAIMIQVAGTIDASGGGGLGALADNSQPGGGGGGSGGMIGLDAPMVVVTGDVFANGGGGGEGSGTGFAGADGGESAAPNTAALGGVGIVDPTFGGNGGDGSAAATTTGGVGMPDDSDGGGGGGGGAGLIKVFGTLTNTGSIAPPPG